MATIDLSRVPVFYHGYIQNVSVQPMEAAFKLHQTELLDALQEVPESKWDYKYAEGKWSIKELVQHVIDAERIFAYRALCFARKDETVLPGFDENTYVASSGADKRNKADLLEELGCVQRSSALLFKSFDEGQLNETGIANGQSVYVEAIGYIIIGHALHHKKVLLERYL